MEFMDHVHLLNVADPQLAAAIGRFRTLEHVLNWPMFRGADLKSLDLIAQDEYSHDMLMPLPDGKRWLAFAMT